MKYLFTSLFLTIWTFFLLLVIDIFVRYFNNYQAWTQKEFDLAAIFCLLTGLLYYFKKHEL